MRLEGFNELAPHVCVWKRSVFFYMYRLMTPGLAYTGLSKTRKNLPGLETLDRQDPFVACTFLTKPNHTDLDMQD